MEEIHKIVKSKISEVKVSHFLEINSLHKALKILYEFC